MAIRVLPPPKRPRRMLGWNPNPDRTRPRLASHSFRLDRRGRVGIGRLPTVSLASRGLAGSRISSDGNFPRSSHRIRTRLGPRFPLVLTDLVRKENRFPVPFGNVVRDEILKERVFRRD